MGHRGGSRHRPRPRCKTHPLRYINDLEDVTTSELVALLNEAADMIDPAYTEPRTARASNRATKSAQEAATTPAPVRSPRREPGSRVRLAALRIAP